MKFTAREDIEAPIDVVFGHVSDFATLERSALRRGAEVQRIDDLAETGPGMMWDTAFMLRGKRREMKVELTEFDPPNGMIMLSRSANISGRMVLDLVALSRARTRLNLDIEIEPKTLAARLMVQSLKLAQGNLNKRLRMRVAEFGRDLEERSKTVG
ncbi:SRPBCC family protein [Roseovarius aestuariivivens]|uniref:SRPBCC family protein n=1 Tax=Roseovarius aestuariivivens TaxID=1888910 RepID=UPI0010802BAD|nr:SRPBCC family protein [Roseovarius aestuariivivens]